MSVQRPVIFLPVQRLGVGLVLLNMNFASLKRLVNVWRLLRAVRSTCFCGGKLAVAGLAVAGLPVVHLVGLTLGAVPWITRLALDGRRCAGSATVMK